MLYLDENVDLLLLDYYDPVQITNTNEDETRTKTMMRTVTVMWHAMLTRIARVYHFSQLVLGNSSYKPDDVTPEIKQMAMTILKVLDDNERDRSKVIGEISEQLEQCYDLFSLMRVTNDRGYNILQMTVMSGQVDVLQFLLESGLDPNTGLCSPPLHLACFLGDQPAVELLLKFGAKTSYEAGMCHPEPHVPVRHVPSRFHFLETDIYLCDGQLEVPLLYAVKNDNVKIVELLLNYRGRVDAEWPMYHYPLHYACHCGAYQSMEYLVKVKPSELGAMDFQSLTPLLHGVKWGKQFVQYLVEAGSDVHACTKDGRTSLHLLYKKTYKPLDLYDTTRYLLAMGLEQDVNKLDSSGNSLLHELVTHVNFLLSSLTGMSESQQVEYDNHVVATLDLLGRNNCEMNQVNSGGITALHKLLLTFEFIISNDPTGITLEALPVREKYKVDFKVLYQALEVLLKHGADPNSTTSAGRTALHILLHSSLNVEVTHLENFAQGYYDCISLLCKYGAKPSCTLASHANIVSVLSKLGRKCLSHRDEDQKTMMAKFLRDLMSLLVQSGLNCNHKTLTSKRRASDSGCGNLLVEMVKQAQYIRQPSDLEYIYSWVLTLLQWGANPDIEPYPSDPIICHSQSSIFLKPKSTQAVNQYMYEIQDFRQVLEGGHAQKLLLLFYNSMQHDALFQSISSAKFMSRFDPNRVPSSHFLKMLNGLLTQPRTLQQMSRVAIYRAIDRQLQLKVPLLPLPTCLKTYLLNVE